MSFIARVVESGELSPCPRYRFLGKHPNTASKMDEAWII